MRKIFVSTYPFCRTSFAALDLLNSSNYKYHINTHSRKMTANEIYSEALDYDGIIAGTEDLSKLIQESKNLKIISRVGIGLDSIPLEICKSKGIAVAYTPDAVTDAVVELTLGLLISGSRRVLNADRDTRQGGWTRFYGKRLGGSVIGIIGSGRIGTKVIKSLLPLKPQKILINDIESNLNIKQILNLATSDISIEFASKDRIYKESDFLSFHLPLTNETKNLVTDKEFKLLKTDVTIVNTARGGIINEEALYNFLEQNKSSYACIDVFENEPYFGKLTELDNILLTQHMASCSIDCRERMELEATQNVLSFFKDGTVLADAIKDNLGSL